MELLAKSSLLVLGLVLQLLFLKDGIVQSARTNSRNPHREEKFIRQEPPAEDDSGFITCSNQVSRLSSRSVTTGACMQWSRGQVYEYPEDFTILNQHEMYVCPESGYRILRSNGIPDHTVEQRNPNSPCEQHYHVQLPLNPTFGTQVREPSASGIIAMSLNGVPAFGAQESGGTNAAEPLETSDFTAVPWHGHAAGKGNWHYHSGEFGLTDDLSTTSSETLLGYAMDGFPIYGPLEDDSVLDDCGGRTAIDDDEGSYQYHVRLFRQIDHEATYCDGTNTAINWGYVIGCFMGDLSNSAVSDSESTPLPSDCVLEADQQDEGPTNSPVSPAPQPTAPPEVSSSSNFNFIVMQPDDFEFMENWTPPPHFRPNGAVYFPQGGLPHIEQLRKDGLQMMQAYTASPMCGTSRYSTITGRYPSRSSYGRERNFENAVPNVVIPTTKLSDNENVLDGADCSNNNIAALLQQNGYRTGMVGKWHLQPGNQYTYTGSQDHVRSCGFDYAEAVYKDNLGGRWQGDDVFSHNMEYVTKKAIDFIMDPSDKPFFLYLNPTVPHGSGDVSDALIDFPCTATPEGILSEEPSIAGMTEGTTCAAYRQTILERAGPDATDKDLGSIWVDDSIGVVLNALQATNQLENTFFLFQLDHGQEGKSSLYEPGIRLAQFIHFPAVFPDGIQFNGLVSTVDIAPTIADFAGITESSLGYYEMDGHSWREAIETVLEDDNEEIAPINDYFENERCLFFELNYDRAVRCGACEKYLQLDDATEDGTAFTGERFGMVFTGPYILFNLCDDETGLYDIYENHENTAVAVATPDDGSSNPVLLDLQTLEACHANRTLPDEKPLYVTCGPTAPLAEAVPSRSGGDLDDLDINTLAPEDFETSDTSSQSTWKRPAECVLSLLGLMTALS